MAIKLKLNSSNHPDRHFSNKEIILTIIIIVELTKFCLI